MQGKTFRFFPTAIDTFSTVINRDVNRKGYLCSLFVEQKSANYDNCRCNATDGESMLKSRWLIMSDLTVLLTGLLPMVVFINASLSAQFV